MHILKASLVSLMLVAVVAALGAPGAWASNARNAPTVDNFSSIDISNFYMFRDPSGCAPAAVGCNIVLAMTVQPFADPKANPTYHFDPKASYLFNFSNTPANILTGKPNGHIKFVFSPFGNNEACPAPNPPCQTFEATFPKSIIIDGLVTQGTAAATPNAPIITTSGSIKIFAGPREEPFFFDLVGFQRFLSDFNSQPANSRIPHFNLFTGKDSFLGDNVLAIVVEMPITMLLGSGNTKAAAWVSTVMGHQIDRLGQPFVAWSLIPPALNDAFDFDPPANDAVNYGPTINSTLTGYGVDQKNVLPILMTAFIPDTLKFDTTKPDGYLNVPPNGQRLTDRVTDFLITLFFNVQGAPGTQHPGNVTCPGVAVTAFSDCTNSKVPLAAFPFLGPPLQQTP